jgi:glutamine synthetase
MADSKLAELERRGVTTVRICYPDLHGICRGKEFPATFFEHLVDDGAAHCEAIMTVDLRHNVVAGFEHGFQDAACSSGRLRSSRRRDWCR